MTTRLDPKLRYLKALFQTTLYKPKPTTPVGSPASAADFTNSVTQTTCPPETYLQDTGKLLIINDTDNKPIARYILVKKDTDEAYVQIWSSDPALITVGRVH